METQNLDQNAKRIAALGLQFDCSDIGNMERFITKHREYLRYVSDRNCWAHWNGSFWSFGAKETAYELALQTIKSIYNEITACSVEAGVTVQCSDVITKNFDTYSEKSLTQDQ